jgi:hypothetical protein
MTTLPIRTLKTGFFTEYDPFGGIYFSSTPTPTRLAVPLTTTWTQPPSCGPVYYYETGACRPPYFDEVWDFGGYYSPGFCYSGFTIGCYADQTSVNWETTAPAETVAFCVPTSVHVCPRSRP